MTLLEEDRAEDLVTPDHLDGGSVRRDPEDAPPAVAELLRPILAAALATAAAGLVAGGIFGSWGARCTGLLGAGIGAGWALVSLRSRRTALVQAAFPLVILLAAAIGLVVRGESPGDLPKLVGDAIDSGRLFRPPVPFDAGWTVILLVLFALVGFAAAWVGAGLGRARLAVAVPLPLVALTAITQPESGQLIAGLCAFVPILAALAVLFGGDKDRASELDSQFELKRAVRGVVLAIPAIAVLIVASKASFLFPSPVYDPTDQPQKPKPVPLSASKDRVLFEVKTTSPLTGPWRTGVLDVYEDGAWKLPPFDPKRLKDIPGDGVIDDTRAGQSGNVVAITLRDLGDAPVLPTLGGTTTYDGDIAHLAFDPRTDLLRLRTGRAPRNATYQIKLPDYASEDQLNQAKPASGPHGQLEVPAPPKGVRALLAQAPTTTAWAKLDFLRSKLLGNVAASGAGAPVDVTPERVDAMFQPKAKATPFEIAAAEALLARWAGIPSRVGFGFDGLNDEKGVKTVRPRNAAQWLEVRFDGYGWVPLVGAPQQAEASLDTDPNDRFDPNVVPSDDVAVEIYLPFELEDLTQLYQRIRNELYRWLPVLLVLGAGWLTWPFAGKAHRRAKRRRWASAIGPRAQVAVEYAELRDLATDLNVADIYSTPLEYLFEVRDDAEHAEMSWLVARTLYGDLRASASTAEADAAEAMGASLRRRIRQAQPVLTQLAAAISRASIKQPYTSEVPNIRVPRAPRLPRPALRRRRRRGTPAPGRVRRRGGRR
jgi:transglutaminase-like putative cysteine protease